MTFNEIMLERHACKLFSNQKIPNKIVESILESGRLAPSSCGFEP